MTTRAMILLSVLTLAACDKADEQPAAEAPTEQKADAHDAFTDLSPDQVSKLIDDKKCVAVDSNSAKTREKYGMLPGAVQLTSYNEYDASELPSNKATKLVFYCGGQKCSAAPKAAKVAVEAGYSDVNVMRAGIKGWVDADKKVDKPKS
jgi:rhodanese-related sulfurtransferase